MTGKVFVDLAISLDGYIAGPNAGISNPLGDNGPRLHQWKYGVAAFRALLGLPGGSTGADNDLVREVTDRAGAFILGRRMFDEGEVSWPDPSPFAGPVFVLTNTPREPWVRRDNTFYFVTDGARSALDQARAAAGEKDVQISGGAGTVCQYLNAGLVDELQLHIAPVLLGAGTRLFDGCEPGLRVLSQTRVSESSKGTVHVRYALARS